MNPYWLTRAKDGKRVNQANIRAFGCFNRTHTTVMGRVHIAHLKPGPFTSQATRPKSRNAAFVRYLGQGIVLIHKLRQLATTNSRTAACRRF